MQKRLAKVLDENEIIYEHQFCFQKNKNKTLVVLDLSSKIIKIIEKQEYACSVFLDFAKEFDTVGHSILLKKFEHYSIKGVPNKWFPSYLNNRCQAVKINSKLSKKASITCSTR